MEVKTFMEGIPFWPTQAEAAILSAGAPCALSWVPRALSPGISAGLALSTPMADSHSWQPHFQPFATSNLPPNLNHFLRSF